MHVSATAVSMNVADVEASARFVEEHFGFAPKMAAEGFVSLEHPGSAFNVIFLEVGLRTFRPASIAGPAGQGLLVVLVVDDLDAEFARIASAGATVVTAPETEPWGERFCQFADPNGIVWQLVQWVG